MKEAKATTVPPIIVANGCMAVKGRAAPIYAAANAPHMDIPVVL
jgi:hypothetical protein